MRIKQLVAEDFVNYKLPSMFIGSCHCSWKCCIEQGLDIGVCQNAPLSNSPEIDMSNQDIYEQFISNPITKAVVIGGLEPFIQINEILDLITLFRENGEDCPFILYSGYYPDEVVKPLNDLKKYNNVVVKFGRFIPGHKAHYDDVLGVMLASDNQYAEVVS